MGEVAMSSENGMELQVREAEMERPGEKGTKNVTAEEGVEGGSETVRWERFLPKMVVRVLLVEADDSTRQIISALLRKCSYRVAAVSDGLKAWEVLTARPHNIDLILTEVELPSVSGYALLTLIMEHDVCKNIPVIMMSSHDSVSTVYKCMLRGATDFLVKPVRKNELRNLWQHVWRKQASSTAAGPGPPDESVAQEKDEATAENNDTSNHSSGYMSCMRRNKEGIEKGSDAQSSCGKPGSKAEEEEDTELVKNHPSKPESPKCVSDGISTPGQEECHQQKSKNRAHDSETEGFQVAAESDADYAVTREDKTCDDNQEQSEYFLREAIDLIGTFDSNHLKKGSLATPASISSANKFNNCPMLDLSLRRSQVNDESQRLNHSDASAFSRYVNKPLQLSPGAYNLHKDIETSSDKQAGSTLYSPSTPAVQTGWPEFTFSYSKNRDISHPVPVRGVGFGNLSSPYGSITPSSGSPSLPSQGATHHSESFPQSNPHFQSDHQPSTPQQLLSPADHRNSSSVDQTENKQGSSKMDELEDHGLVSHGTNQSANSSFCNGNISHHHSHVAGCNGTIKGHEDSFHHHDGPSHRAMQREAALTKFRQKRKDRCFEKKVRYESRKKLAEQRPRVKGQFVRQLPTDQPESSSAG
ncbi:two-component response regulator-like APRR3 [Salvia divinorum]|uniref:Two-component response regulator-like APRR3 n=1 Tax=Salvia divinorum TaxID=28513 RepID=A0ABD1HNP9_SALDI